MLGNLFLGTLAWEPLPGNLAWNLLETLLGNLFLKTLLGTSWEPCLGTCCWEPLLGNLFLTLLRNLTGNLALGTLLGNLFLGTSSWWNLLGTLLQGTLLVLGKETASWEPGSRIPNLAQPWQAWRPLLGNLGGMSNSGLLRNLYYG